jgi:hypothetical protein
MMVVVMTTRIDGNNRNNSNSTKQQHTHILLVTWCDVTITTLILDALA